MEDVFSLFVPHPPIIIEEIGGPHISEVKGTRESLFRLARELAAEPPDTLVISSPHTSGSPGYIGVLTESHLSGSFGEFGHHSLTYAYENDNELVDEILQSTESLGVVEPTAMSKLDHGVLRAYGNVQAGPRGARILGLSGEGRLSSEAGRGLLNLGQAGHLLGVREEAGPDPPASGRALCVCRQRRPFALYKGRSRPLDEDFLHRAQQCGLFSFLIGFGVMDGVSAKGEVYSYEDTFGVGYLVGAIRPAK